MKYALKDVVTSLPQSKRKSDSIWTKIWGRPIGNVFAWVFLNIGITPNIVSIFVVLIVLIGFIFCCINSFIFALIGLIIFNFFIVFDCVDGSMARTLKKDSYMGEFFDAVGGYTMCLFSMCGASIICYNFSGILPQTFSLLIMFVGCLGGSCDIFSRLVYQKYTSNVFISDYKRGKQINERENDSVDRDNWKRNVFLYARLLIDGEFGTGGFFPIILLISFLFGFLDIVVIIYSFYHILALFLIIVVFCVKASRYDKKSKENNE